MVRIYSTQSKYEKGVCWKDLLDSLNLVINLKRLLIVIKEWDTPWISCLVVNRITVNTYDFLFNCIMVGQVSDLVTALT